MHVSVYRRRYNIALSSRTKLCKSPDLISSWRVPHTKLFSFTPANTFVAAFHFTIALLPGGPAMITSPPVWYKPEFVKSEKSLEDAEFKELLTKPLRENKKAKKKVKADGEDAKAE